MMLKRSLISIYAQKLKRPLSYAIFFLLIFLNGCSKHKLNEPTIKWTRCEPNSEITEESIVQWNLECGTLQVPLDYTNPDGEKITLSLIHRSARGPGDYIGTIITNPGGPGGPGVSDLADASAAYSKIFQGYFDQVSFDPRGIGLSEPYINCHNAADELNGADPGLIPTGMAQVIDGIYNIWQQCEANFSQVLPFMGTLNVARDMERIRIALGGKKINYLGYSYGTLLGAVYAMLFPDNIRTMVLDGSLLAEATLYKYGVDSALSYELTLDRFFQECDKNIQCPLHGSAQSKFETLLSNLRMHEMSVPATYGNLPPYLTSGWFITAAAAGVSHDWIGLANGIYQAVTPPFDGTLLLTMAAQSVARNPDGTYYENSNEMYNIVQCIDFSDRPDADRVQSLANSYLDPIPALAPNLGPYGVRISTPLCIGADVSLFPPDPVPPIVVKGTPPIVVVGNIGDPQTPYSWGQSMTSAIEGSVLLTWDGGGHTIFAGGVSNCIDSTVMNYFRTVVPPPTGLACPSEDPWTTAANNRYNTSYTNSKSRVVISP